MTNMEDCPFCRIPKDKVIAEDDYFIAIKDEYPVSAGHALIISKRHITDMFELTHNEWNALQGMIYVVAGRIKCDGYNIGCNCGEAAGQTVMHFHLHVIPRYKGDVENPRGGVRGVIPSKMHY